VTYQYRLQRNHDPNSWLVRWEFLREKPRANYDYPLAHIHVNGAVADRADGHRLHFPTRRVPLEFVLWLLIVDVTSLSTDWRTILSDFIEGFEERQSVR
jgi:hypothetical protein